MSNSVLNKFISDVVAFETRVEGSVSVYAFEGDFDSAIKLNGFAQCECKGGAPFEPTRKTNQFFNAKSKECVFLCYTGKKEFTLSDAESNPL